jgi:hypothetical protein
LDPSWFLSNQYLLLFLSAASLADVNFIAFDLISSGLQPMIYRTRGEHALIVTTSMRFGRLML